MAHKLRTRIATVKWHNRGESANNSQTLVLENAILGEVWNLENNTYACSFSFFWGFPILSSFGG